MKTLLFRPNSSEAEHRIRILEAGSVFSYDAPYDSISTAVRKIEVELPQLTEGSTVYVTAVDAAGNESDPLQVKRNNIMSKLGTKTLRFTPSASGEAVDHRVRIIPDGTEFSYAEPFVAVGVAVNDEASGKIAIDLGSLSIAPQLEGVYDIYVTAVDASNNESDPLPIDDVRLDFVAPAAPTDGEVV